MHEALGTGTKLLAVGGGCVVLCAICLVTCIILIGAGCALCDAIKGMVK